MEPAKKEKLSKRAITIIVSSAVLFAIVLSIAIVAVINLSTFNYEKKNLGRYVTVPENLFKSYNVTVEIPEITDKDVTEEIYKLLCSRKITPEGPIYSMPNVTISAGDVVYLYYRGYTMENDMKTYFDGGCNFNGNVTSLEIGSGTFITGFESGLIGKNQQNYATIDVKKSGTIAENDIITITYSVIRADGTVSTNQTVTLDLADPTRDERWGEGFGAYFVGKTIDADNVIESDPGLIFPTVCEGETGQDAYHDVTIQSACAINDSVKEKLIVEATFPYNYSEATLKGKTAYFEVYIKGVDDYGVYEFDESFITNELKVTEADLTYYEGANLVEKYKAYIKEALEEQRRQEINLIVEESFWEQIMAATAVKKLPEREVDKMYNKMYAQIVGVYETQASGTAYENNFDAFARAFLELSSSADWKAYLRQDAEEAIKEKLIFYYIMQAENLKPSEEEYNEIYEAVFADHLQDYLDYYKITPEVEDYEKKLADGKKEVLETYGKTYFEELVVYDYVMSVIIARANVIVAH